MNTFLYDLALETEDRWREVDSLISHAEKTENIDKLFHDALCRAIIVLTVAQLERYVRDIAKCTLQDINKFSSFAETPSDLKRTFCKTFLDGLPSGLDTENRTQSLIKVFDSLSPKFILDPFLVEDARGNNKNPSPNIISRIFINFGIKDIFVRLHNSKIDTVFNGEPSEANTVIRELREHVLEKLQYFPYQTDSGVLEIKPSTEISKKNKTLYQEFLDELLNQRNNVAHGSSLPNSKTIQELRLFRDKVIILGYALLILMGTQFQIEHPNDDEASP